MTNMSTYRKEYDNWRAFLNREMTYFMVGAGISVIALSLYVELVIVLFIFVAAIAHTSGKFPRLIKSLRNKKRSRADNYKYHGMLKTDFGIKSSLTSFLPYTLACIFLVSILAGAWN